MAEHVADQGVQPPGIAGGGGDSRRRGACVVQGAADPAEVRTDQAPVAQA